MPQLLSDRTIRNMASELYRWQAAMGAIAGSLVADALALGQSEWTERGGRSLDIADDLIAGAPTPLDLTPDVAVPTAVGLASTGAPLLMNSTTVALIDLIGRGLEGDVPLSSHDPLVSKAIELARSGTFVDAVAGAGGDPELASLVGAMVGIQGGLGAVPARLVSSCCAPDGTRGRRYLRRLSNRLLGIELPNWYDPRRRRGPKEVLPGLWLSNLYGLSRFIERHPDGLVLSLCDEEGRLADHAHHVTFHLEDKPGSDANPSLSLVVDEVLAEIRSARDAGQPVLVHCRHGASRTGLILRALLVEELGLSADDAIVEAQCHWTHTSTWNRTWAREVERRSALWTGD